MKININAKDYELIRKFEDILRRGYYASGEQVTQVHNRVLGTSLRSTNCSACISQRIRALVDAANKFDRLSEAEKTSNEVVSSPTDELKHEELAVVNVDKDKAVTNKNKKTKK